MFPFILEDITSFLFLRNGPVLWILKGATRRMIVLRRPEGMGLLSKF